MKTTVTRSDFHRAFEAIRPSNFSYAALDALFDHFEELEQGAGIEIELDVIAICCEFTEETYEQIRESYEMSENATEEIIQAYLHDHTHVVAVLADSVVYAAF
jgi:hypothetical protein